MIPNRPILQRLTAGSRVAIVLAVLVASLSAVPPVIGGRAAAATPVSVFPIAGSRVASPNAQIVFRGIPVSQLTGITVTGSKSGVHSGSVKGDSDGNGGSFLPAKPFVSGEVVTVHTPLDIVGGAGGTFHFTIADPAGAIPFRGLPSRRPGRGELYGFRSAAGLGAPAVRLTRKGGSGDIFLAAQQGPVRDGPEIIDGNGHLVWYQAAPANDSVTDFRTQSYEGHPVLTWWQGNVNGGTGRGSDVILDQNYRQVATVQAGNGLSADLHEFRITSSNTALITAYYPVYWDARSVHGSSRQIVLDSVAQEVDIPTGLVLFQWDSLDHVPLTNSYVSPPSARTKSPYDYFHINSIDPDRDGNLVVSSRNTWAAYKVNHQTGAVIWTLGGKHSSFRMGAGAGFAFQHDVRVRSAHDWYITMFDDGGGPPAVHKQSRALKLFLDVTHKRARMVSQREHSPGLSAFYEGNDQQTAHGDDFVGWGAQPYFTDYNSRGRVVLDGRYVGANSSYRAYRLSWSGTPTQPPAIAAVKSSGHTQVYASWNGATAVWSWRVVGGTSPASLTTIGSSPNHGFETEITTGASPDVAVEALDRSGQVLGRSAVIAPK